MRISNQDLISRGTANAHTRLMVAASAACIVELFGLNSSTWDFGIRELSQEDFSGIATICLIFLALSYSINYYGDLQFFRSWSSLSVVGDDQFESVPYDVTVPKALRRVMTEVRERIPDEKFIERAMIGTDAKKGNLPEDSISEIRQVTEKYAEAAKRLEKIFDGVSEGYSRIDCFGRLVLWTWYGIVPAAFWVVSLILLCPSLPSVHVSFD